MAGRGGILTAALLLLAIVADPARSAELAVQSCSTESSLQSLVGTPASIQFVNATSQPVSVYWIDYAGNRVLYRSLSSGESYLQFTFLTHPWVVVTASNQCLGIFLPLTGSNTATVTGEGSTAPPPTAQAVSGTVVVKTPTTAQALATGGGVASGSLIQTESDGTVTLAFPGGAQLAIAPNTQVTLLPSIQPSGAEIVLNQIRGRLTHTVVNPTVPEPDRYRVQTAIATVRPTGTAFSTQYGEVGRVGGLVVDVQQGQVEVESRSAQFTTLIAGQQGSFSDAVPRVIPILPVDRGWVVAGTVNTFSWTTFAGASGYLFEFTLSPAGFAQANPAGPEAGAGSLQVRAGTFIETGGTVDFSILVPTGVVAPGDQARWRVFPTNAAGQVLPGATASDASSVSVLEGRASISTIAPAAGALILAGTSHTFSWTSFPGAAGYLFEFTLNPAGFVQANPSAPESPANTFRVMGGAFIQTSATIQFTVRVPSGVAPAGTPAQWRIFPLNAAGQVLPDAMASDASALVLQ